MAKFHNYQHLLLVILGTAMVLTKRNCSLLIWLAITISFAWLIFQGHYSFDSPATLYVLIALLLSTTLLLFWFPVPKIEDDAQKPAGKRFWFIVLSVISVLILFLARTLVGPPLLFAWPIIAIAVLIYLKPTIDRRQATYALLLGLIAGLAGLGAGWVDFSPLVWAALQVALVVTGLLAGWALLRHTGLWQAGIGNSQYLNKGAVPALKHFGQGILISIPWALGLILIGGAQSETWLDSWWQPFTAISAGIGEEVWGRIFPSRCCSCCCAVSCAPAAPTFFRS